MTPDDIKHGLQQGLNLLETLASIAAALGGDTGAEVAKIATSVANIGNATMDAINAGQLVMDAVSAAQVSDIVATIRLRNDALAEEIAAS